MHRTKISPLFFSRGSGGTKLELLERMIKQLFPEVEGQNWPPTIVKPVWKTVWETKNACLREGVFRESGGGGDLESRESGGGILERRVSRDGSCGGATRW